MNKYINCIHQCIQSKEPLRGSANTVPQKLKEGLPYVIGTAVLIGGGIVAYNKLSKKEEQEEPLLSIVDEEESSPIMNLSFGPKSQIEISQIEIPEADLQITEKAYQDTLELNPDYQETTDMPEGSPVDSFFGESIEVEGAANTVQEEIIMESHPLDSNSGLGDDFNVSMDLDIDEGVLM